MQPEGFANDAFDPVASNSAAHLARNTDAQATVRVGSAQINKNKAVSTQSCAISVHSVEFTGFPEKTGLRQPEPLHSDQAERRLRPLARRRLMTA